MTKAIGVNRRLGRESDNLEEITLLSVSILRRSGPLATPPAALALQTSEGRRRLSLSEANEAKGV